VVEKHPEGVASTEIEVTEGCTATATGPLVTPAAVTVIVAVPAMGLFEASVPLQTTKIESQTPPHTWPAGDTVATLVLDELKVKTEIMEAFAEFTAFGVIVTTSPAFIEIVDGVTRTAATVFVVDEELPPQPATNDKNRMAMIAEVPVKCRLPGLFPRVLSNN
jgi:hypothetical protein